MGNRAGEQIGLPWGILRSWRPQDDGSKWIAPIVMTRLLRSCLAAGKRNDGAHEGIASVACARLARNDGVVMGDSSVVPTSEQNRVAGCLRI